jgi:cysteine desulfurase
MVYLDWAATAPPDEECMQEALRVGREVFANPSSQHAAGRLARASLESSRASLASVLGCEPSEIVFTSGASESNWLVLSSALSRLRPEARASGVPSVVATGIEHPSVHEGLETLRSFGMRVTTVPALRAGTVDPEEVASHLDPGTIMVLVMAVNNVTGAVQPVSDVAAVVRSYSAEHGRRIIVHADAVQALGKLPLDLATLGADTASFSAHKIGGPRGVGALYLRSGTPFEPLVRGEQERGLRAGTENCPGAAAFACAARKRQASLARDAERAGRLAAILSEGLAKVPGCVPLPEERWRQAGGAAFSPFILSAAFPPIPSEVLVRVLSAQGICVSSGSACASRSREKRERVYRNMGVPARLSASAIRVSTGPGTTEDDVARLTDALSREVPRLTKVAE